MDAFQRGGDWNNSTNAGVETLNLNNTPGNTNNNIGFRCARYSLLFGPNEACTHTSSEPDDYCLIPSPKE